MAERELEDVVKYFLNRRNFDHTDMEKLDQISRELDITSFQYWQAFFVARDLSSLTENEILDGGTGTNTQSVDYHELLEATFSRGEGFDAPAQHWEQKM